MDNQHKKIKGYRDLSQEEIDMMNEVKEKGVELGELIDKVNAFNGSSNDEGLDESVRRSSAFRWSAIARTDLQTGLMALTRAIAKPGFF